MFILTKDGTVESGAYATRNIDGDIVVQLFVDKDDALCYNTHLGAIDQELMVTEVADENIDKLCDLMGYGHTVVKPGQVVVPRLETLENDANYDSLS